jgi:transcriptional regulator with XRE-family HTH domain
MLQKPTIPIRIGKAVRKRREALKVSQEAFADELGVHRTYYGSIERGVKDIRVSTLERVCEGLGIRVSELFQDIEKSG